MICIAVNTITYGPAPAVSSAVAMLLAACALGLFFVSAVYQQGKAIPVFLMVLTLVALTTINHFLVDGQQIDVLFRYVTAVAALFVLHVARIPDLRRVFSYVAMGIIAYAAFAAAAAGSYKYAGTPRFYPFWSGVASSSLLIAAITILIALTPLKRATKAFWVSLGLVVVVGYGVVTTTLMLALFFGGWWFLRKGWNRFWLYSFGVAAVIGGIIFRDANSVEGSNIETLGIGAIGSGRVDAWLGRFQDFAERDFPTMMFGLGPYSDYQFSALWDWEAKNAHSDLVTMLMEFGILGLCLVLFMGVLLYKRANAVEKLALIAIVFGAAASNPLLDRPVVAAAWGFALYACRYHKVVLIPPRKRGEKHKRPSACERPLRQAVRESSRAQLSARTSLSG